MASEPQVCILKKFLHSKPEPDIQVLEANNKVFSTRSIDFPMEQHDELLCCFAFKKIIEELSLDHSAKQIDFTDSEIQIQILTILTSIMIEDKEIR